MIGKGVDLNVRNSEHWSPLHLAVKRGNYDIVAILLNTAKR